MTNFIFKLNMLLSGRLGAASYLGADGDPVNTIEATSATSQAFTLFVDKVITLVDRLIYTVCSFILNVIELLQYVFQTFLGISTDIKEYVVLDTRNPLVSFLTNETVLTVFRSMIAVAIVLIIVFTIYSIIRSEYNIAVDGDLESNNKNRIFARSMRSFFILGMFPLFLLVGIILVNALLAGFNDILRGGSKTTIAGQIFATSAYSANNYRRYADNDTRVPIIINFEDPYSTGLLKGYSPEELNQFYKNFQPTGRKIYDSYADMDFEEFSKTVSYRNNKLSNQATYSGFEKFVCTREQYYVMADFIDYAVKNNLRYYIKNMKDEDINWKYVSDTVYNKDEKTLKITYKDASNINGGKEYTVIYSSEDGDIATPIGDAVKTISALLGIGEYSDYTFNALNRLDDTINVVEWATDSVLLKFSDDFVSAFRSGNTRTIQQALKNNVDDQILLFEYARYRNNNSITCSFNEFLNNGFVLQAKKIDKRVYEPATSSYASYDEHYVVSINNHLYVVEQNPSLKDKNGNLVKDSYGDPYYTLVNASAGMEIKDYNTNAAADDPVNILAVSADGKNICNMVRTSTTFIDCEVSFQDGKYPGSDGEVVLYQDKLSSVIKQMSWPQKLINDLQVIYKDININNEIATGRWLTQMSEYYQEQSSNPNSSNIATALVHPLGLILSEFFLGDVQRTEEFNLYGSLMFNTCYDEDTIRALMVSIVGEENYFQLKYQLEYFNEIYNVMFAPVLDEIAFNENFELLDGNEASVKLYTYKAFLASLLLSSSGASWLYDTAITLVGASDFANDILNPDGSYMKYSDLDGKYKHGKFKLENILESQKELYLKYHNGAIDDQNNVVLPEYFDALDKYIKGKLMTLTQNLGFTYDEMLTSWVSEGVKAKRSNEAYHDLLEAYNYIVNNKSIFINDVISEDAYNRCLSLLPIIDDAVFENGWENKEVLLKGSDIFGAADTIYLIDYIKTEAKNILENVEEITGRGDFYNKISEFCQKMNAFAQTRTDYLEEDQSYKFVGKMQDLIDILNTYKNQLKAYGISDDDLTYSATNNQNRINELAQNKTKNDEDRNAFISLYGNLHSAYLNVMRLNRFYITYAATANARINSNPIKLDIVVNRHHYTVGTNYTIAKFVEYVLGYKVLIDSKYEPVFIEKGYEGLVNVEKKVTNKLDEDGEPIVETTVNSFGILQEFLCGLGNISAQIYQMTNFTNLATNAHDEILLGAMQKENVAVDNDVAKVMLEMLISNNYLPSDIMMAFFNISQSSVKEELKNNHDSKFSENDAVKKLALDALNAPKSVPRDKLTTYNNDRLNAVLSYLLLSDNIKGNPGYVDYSKKTLKEIRLECLRLLANFEEQAGETVEQNQKRYMALFALACSDWLTHDKTGNLAEEYLGAKDNSWSEERRSKIAKLEPNRLAQSTILRLAGLENRPYSELVHAEYTIDFNTKGSDEANGSVFIICTYDEETREYIPFMMSNIKNSSGDNLPKDEDNKTWVSKYENHSSFTEYYKAENSELTSVFYPVVAKGIVDANGYPTAIRENEGFIEFYRDDIVLRDASNIGLEQYYLSPSQVRVSYNMFSLVTNAVSKIFTGKTLVEHISKIPRFMAHSDLNFLYGVDRLVEDKLQDGYTIMSFNFDQRACVQMDNLYSLKEMSMLILIIGTVTMLTALWKALFGVVQRVFDITVYFLLGPVAISTLNLSSDSMDKKSKSVQENTSKIYSTWKTTMISNVVSVFAYAIGFNIFFIVAPIISDMTLFNSMAAFQSLPLFNKISLEFVNEVARLIFLIAAAYLSVEAPKMFAGLTQTANGFETGEKTLKNVKNTINAVADVTSGQMLLDKIANAKETAMSMIPGSQVAREAIGKYKQIKTKLAVKSLEAAAVANGVPPELAKKAAEKLEKEMVAMQGADKQFKESRAKARAARNEARLNDSINGSHSTVAADMKDYYAKAKELRKDRKEKGKKLPKRKGKGKGKK